jgi:hypothetical protein
MATEIKVVTKNSKGQTEFFKYTPGGKHPAVAATSYQLPAHCRWR